MKTTERSKQKAVNTFRDDCYGISWQQWCFVFIVTFLALLTVRDLASLIVEFLDFPKTSDLNVVFNKSIALPTVTFCIPKEIPFYTEYYNISRTEKNAEEWDRIVEKSLAKYSTKEQLLNASDIWDARLTIEAFTFIANSTNIEIESNATYTSTVINSFRMAENATEHRRTFKKWLRVLRSLNITFSELSQRVGTQLMRNCTEFFGRMIKEEKIAADFKFVWIGSDDICFQPELIGIGASNVDSQGGMLYFTIPDIVPDPYEINDLTISFHGDPWPPNPYLEGYGRTSNGIVASIGVGQTHAINVEIRAIYEMLANKEEGTECVDRNGGESEIDCRKRCRFETIREMCNCTPPALSYLANDQVDLPLCDFSECYGDVKRNYTESECLNGCFRDCSQVRYEFKHSVTGNVGELVSTDITINWDSFEYIRMEQQWKYNFTTFIAAFGGNLGMWLGLSILSLIQFGGYVYGKICEKIKRPPNEIHPKERRGSTIVMEHFETSPSKPNTVFAGQNLHAHSLTISKQADGDMKVRNGNSYHKAEPDSATINEIQLMKRNMEEMQAKIDRLENLLFNNKS